MKDFKYYTENKVDYAKDRKGWKAEDYRLDNEFYTDLVVDLGITNHPKRDVFIEMVKEHGDSESYSYKYTLAEEFLRLMDV